MIKTEVALFVALLGAAAAVALVARRIAVPYVTLLAVLGAAAGPLLAGHTPRIGHTLILFVLLPGLLFEAALGLEWRHLRGHLFEIAVLATLGVALTTVVIAALGHLALGLPLAAAVLFGAAVAPTDPVAVVATFRRIGVPARLLTLVEAESLANDGTGIVIFGIALAALASPQLAIGAAALDFIRLTVGGLALGAALGGVLSLVTHRIDDAEVEVTLTVLAAYGGYVLGQAVHVSGILCVVAAGVVVGNVGRPRGMSAATQAAVATLWGYVAFLLNAVVFVLIGATVPWAVLGANLGLVLAGAAVALLARALAVYGLFALLRPLGRAISLRWQHLLVWGGLRGAVALALLLSITPGARDLTTVRALVYGVVLASILLQGSTVGWLARRLLPELTHARGGAVPSPADRPLG
ncbi:MAG TPA: sodium:proton antiporter [Candidatus Micrarchaeia archaeon]|nr:sodium:proton antiporter [Candidatus Micrarchaeia archaeon]